MSVPTFDLIGGSKMPIVGFGTAGRSPPDVLEKALEAALESGYRHFDTAYIYRNEEILGKVINKWITSGKIKREELFIVTKLPFSGNTAEKVEESIKESLKRLQLEYVDLYLIHFPIYMDMLISEGKIAEFKAYATDLISLWKKLEEQVDAGRAKTLGLSNFSIDQISRILEIARIKPASLQIEVHLYMQCDEIIKYAQQNNIVVVAYSPLGSPDRFGYSEDSGLAANLLEDKTVVELAKKYKKTPGQVLLKFLVQRNIVVIPKSYTPNRIKDNIDIFDFELDQNDCDTLRGLDHGERARLGFAHPNPPSLAEHPEWPFKSEGPYYVKE